MSSDISELPKDKLNRCSKSAQASSVKSIPASEIHAEPTPERAVTTAPSGAVFGQPR